jgi:hypothetical protein
VKQLHIANSKSCLSAVRKNLQQRPFWKSNLRSVEMDRFANDSAILPDSDFYIRMEASDG